MIKNGELHVDNCKSYNYDSSIEVIRLSKYDVKAFLYYLHKDKSKIPKILVTLKT